MTTTKNDTIDYTFHKLIIPDDSLIDLNRDMNLNLENNDDNILDTDDSINFIESFEIQNNENLKIVTKFIVKYLDRINEIQNTYDKLTSKNINFIVTKNNQKNTEETLKGFRWLASQGNEAERQMIFLQMFKLHKLKYSGLARHLKMEYGDMFEKNTMDDENEEIDEEIDDEIYEENDNNDNMENRDNNRENYESEDRHIVYDYEDNEDGDQDYDYLEVGDDDYL
jgi:hypothetical protein